MQEIIGNENIIELVELLKYKPPLPHILLTGIAGIGKTTVAKYIVEHCNKSLLFEYYGNQLDEFELRFTFNYLADNNIANATIFIDELQMLNKNLLSLLYEPMEDLTLGGINLQPFTLIGATTDLNKIPDALQRRFRIKEDLKVYTRAEISDIIESQCRINEESAFRLANMCKGVPGFARNFVDVIKKIAKEDNIVEEDVTTLQRLLKIDGLGLTETDLDYLIILSRNGIIGLDTIASAINEPVLTVAGKVEPFLLRIKFVIKTPRGRMITPNGRKYIDRKGDI